MRSAWTGLPCFSAYDTMLLSERVGAEGGGRVTRRRERSGWKSRGRRTRKSAVIPCLCGRSFFRLRLWVESVTGEALSRRMLKTIQC